MYKHMLLHIFCIHDKDSSWSKCEIHTNVYKSPVIRQIRGNMEGDTLVTFLVILLPSPNFVQFKYGVISLIIFTVKPC